MAVAFCVLVAVAHSPAQTPSERVNSVRRAVGLPTLSVDRILTVAARDYAGELAKTGALAHHDAAGRDAAVRVRAAGGSLSRVGEVLGAGPTVGAVVAAWQESAAHRAVMLRSDWTHLGIATALRGESSVVVALFARRLHERVAVRSTGNAAVLSAEILVPGTPVAVALSRVYRPTTLDEATGRWEIRFPPGAVPLTLRLGVMRPDGTVETAHVVYPRAAVEAR
jgi:hypothetical protein